MGTCPRLALIKSHYLRTYPLISANKANASSTPSRTQVSSSRPSRTSRPLRAPRGPHVLFGPSEFLEEPGPLVEPLHHLVVVQDLLAQFLMATLAERDVLAHQVAFLDERPHLHVGEPQVVAPDDGVGLLYTIRMEQVAAAWAGDGLLVGMDGAEPGVLGLGVRADGRDRDPVRADGAEDGFNPWRDVVGKVSQRRLQRWRPPG